MTRQQRIRRVAILCCNFLRNFTYYRIGNQFPAGWKTEPLDRDASFWRTANSNFIDQCILDWCKLFGEKSGKHYWAHVVSDKALFESELLKRLRTSPQKFEEYRIEMRSYRDKFLAHLDSDLVMQIPRLAYAKRSIEFYYEWLLAFHVLPGDFDGLPKTMTNLARGYHQCRLEAQRVYRARRSRSKSRRRATRWS